LQAVTPEIAESLGLKRPGGALVASVVPGSPAAAGGVKTGDLIVSVDNQQVDDPNAFDYRFGTKALGGTAVVGLVRSGKQLSANVALRTAPETPRDEIVLKSGSPFAGAKIGNISPALAEELRLDSSAEGVAILDVPSGSAAERIGFRRGDIVVSVNDTDINKTRDLERVANERSSVWRITIQRGGQKLSVAIRG
jgi:S1-C subfamily serine protease